MSSLPPGPGTGWPRQLYAYVYRPTTFLEECSAAYGDAFTLRLGAVGDLVVVHRREHVREVFTAKDAPLASGTDLARPIVGDQSVFVLEGTAHLRRRRLLLPPFHGESVRAYEQIIVDATHAALDRWRPGQRLRLDRDLREITLDVIMRAVFGVRESGELEGLRRAFLELFAPMPALFSFLPQLQATYPGSPFSRWLERRKRVVGMLDDLVRRRRRSPEFERLDDILSLLLRARDADGTPLPDEAVHDELITAVVAGHETTATALCWAFERILSHPEVEQNLKQELAEVAPDVPLASASSLPYLDATIKEVLRQRPALPLVARRLTEPWSIAGFDLPAGMLIAPCLYLSQRDPDVFREPNEFRPARWLDGPTDDGHLYYPFGGGTRRCIGMALAMLEMRAVIAVVLRRAALRLNPEGPRAIGRRTVTLFPKGGVPVIAVQVQAR